MADSSEVLEYLLSHPKSTESSRISYSFLVPNIRGLENALSVSSKPKPGTEAPYTSSKDSKSPLTPPSTPPAEEWSAPTTSTQDLNQMPSSGAIAGSSNSMDRGIDEISVFAAATETFSQKNLNCSIAESLERFRPVITKAKANNIRVRAYLSVVLGCPYEGPNVSPAKVAEISRALMELGADEISLGDTTGMGTAPRTLELLQAIQAASIPMAKVAMHFHDTYGQSLVNTSISLSQGIRIFDGSVGGLGGCPYAKGATGNVASEDLIYFLHSIGMETGVDLAKLAMVGQWVSDQLGRENGSRVGKALITRKDD
jgi:hydroxymethylglutaryl-CoA lyase